MGNLFQELTKRKVFRVAAVYAVVAWLLIQIAGEILPTFEAPLWINQTLIVILLLGFPLAMVLTWAVNLTPDAASSIAVSDTAAASSSPNENWNSIVLGLVVLAMVFLIVDRYWLSGSQVAQVASADGMQQVTRSSINLGYLSHRSSRSFLADIALTPDGSKLIYRTYVDGSRRLYLRDLSTFDSREILDNPNDLPIALTDQSVSPDGKYLYVYWGNEPVLISLENGSRQSLAPAVNQTSATAYNDRGYDWFSDDQLIYAAADGSLYIRSFASGETEKLDIPKLESESLVWPHVLPDDRYIIYTLTNLGEIEDSSIAIFNRETGETALLIEEGFNARYVSAGFIVFMRENELRAVAFDHTQKQLTGADYAVASDVPTVRGTWGRANYALSESGRLVYGQGGDLYENTSRRFELREIGGQVRAVGIPSSGWNRIRLSPDGDKILLHSETLGRTGDVYIYHIDSEVLDRRTFTGVQTPIWSNDGESFVYIESSDGQVNLKRMAVSGMGQPELLYSSPSRIEPFAFTPDGSHLLHTTGLPGSEDLNAAPLNHEAPVSVSLVADSESNDTDVSISPDGRWIAYTGAGSNIFVRPYPNIEDATYQLTTQGGRFPRWGPNSEELFYYGQRRLMRVPLATESGLQRGQTEVLFSDIAGISTSFSYDVSKDGKTFLVPLDTEETDELNAPQFTAINLVDNWFEELRRRAPTGQ